MSFGYISKLIDKHLNFVVDDERNYIGASIIGSECMREIWYSYKNFESESIKPKTRRTWDIGKHLEQLVLNWIEKAGIKIARIWYDLEAENMPYFKGHIDAMWTKKGEAFAIFEIKTAKDSSFKLFVKHGLKKWDPRYYAQIQSYMGMSGVFNAYIVVLNKDNSEIFDEKVEFDPNFYESLKNKAQLIHNAQIPPPRIHNSPAWYQCKMCKFKKVCHSEN